MLWNREKKNIEADRKIVRKHIIFSGRVQGVGFRYTSCALAGPLGLTGWVKNQWDGTVEMEVQGEEALIDRLIQGLSERRWIRIDHMEVTLLPVIQEERFCERY